MEQIHLGLYICLVFFKLYSATDRSHIPILIPALLMISQTAAGVAGTMDLWSRHSFPMFTIWKPSTSFSGAMALHTARSLMCSVRKAGQSIQSRLMTEAGTTVCMEILLDAVCSCNMPTRKWQLHQQAADPPVTVHLVNQLQQLLLGDWARPHDCVTGDTWRACAHAHTGHWLWSTSTYTSQ